MARDDLPGEPAEEAERLPLEDRVKTYQRRVGIRKDAATPMPVKVEDFIKRLLWGEDRG